MKLIQGGLVKTITGGDIENGQILIDGGKIVAVGQNLDVPAGTEIIDAAGCIVTPGFVDAHCHIGMHEEASRWEGNDTNEYSGPVTPEIRAIDGINPRDEAFGNAIGGGVTTAVTGPGSANVLGGTFVAMKLYGDCVDDMILKYPAAMKIAFGENPKGVYGQNGHKMPVTRMAVAATLRETLFKAQRYAKEIEEAEKDATKTRPFDMKLEALLPVLRKEIPLKAHAHRADDILTAIRIAKEFDVDITLDHVTEGHLIVRHLTFNVIGSFFSDLLDAGIGALTTLVENALVSAGFSGVLRSLIIDGVFKGVGSVLSFLPFIVTLFFFLSLLEDSGYMARIAFVMDKPLRRIGLSGRSIVPMLVGFGCTVPGVMATRTLPSERDRKMTILLTPFMSCSAKLPIYAFFSAVFFPRCAMWVMAGLYLLGIVLGVLHATLLRKTLFSGEPVPFVMELPNYRMPGAKNVCQLLWEKSKDFLQRAFTVIFAATIVIWFLQTFDLRLNVVADSKDSLLALTAGWLSPLFKPLGFGDWRICTALLTGFMAKESVVSSLVLLFGSTADLLAVLTPLSAASLLVFSLLYTPCIAAVACIRRELGARWAVGVVLYQCAVAWVFALIVRLVGLALI